MTDDIRCPRCQTLLGRRSIEGVEIRHKDLLVVVIGVALISCRGCGRVETIRSRFSEAEGVRV
jgi:hypothetical protein